jgi:hypothetical protein
MSASRNCSLSKALVPSKKVRTLPREHWDGLYGFLNPTV